MSLCRSRKRRCSLDQRLWPYRRGGDAGSDDHAPTSSLPAAKGFGYCDQCRRGPSDWYGASAPSASCGDQALLQRWGGRRWSLNPERASASRGFAHKRSQRRVAALVQRPPNQPAEGRRWEVEGISGLGWSRSQVRVLPPREKVGDECQTRTRRISPLII